MRERETKKKKEIKEKRREGRRKEEREGKRRLASGQVAAGGRRLAWVAGGKWARVEEVSKGDGDGWVVKNMIVLMMLLLKMVMVVERR